MGKFYIIYYNLLIIGDKRMNLIEVKKADKQGSLPIALNTAYKWSSLKKYPRLLIKVTGKLFFDTEEWQAMAKQSLNNQIKEAKRIYTIKN